MEWSDLLDVSPEDDRWFRDWVERRKQFKECMKIIRACQLDAGYEDSDDYRNSAYARSSGA